MAWRKAGNGQDKTSSKISRVAWTLFAVAVAIGIYMVMFMGAR